MWVALLVLSHKFWERRFRSDRTIVGKTISLHGLPFQVIGVTAPSFGGLTPDLPSFWVPLMMRDDLMAGWWRRDGMRSCGWPDHFTIAGGSTDRCQPHRSYDLCDRRNLSRSNFVNSHTRSCTTSDARGCDGSAKVRMNEFEISDCPTNFSLSCVQCRFVVTTTGLVITHDKLKFVGQSEIGNRKYYGISIQRHPLRVSWID